MPYIGKSPLHGNFNELTDVSGSFDGSETEFALTENLTSTAITPVMPAALIISLNGVVQEPTTDYTVTGTNVTFTTAPQSTDSFFGIVMGKQLDVGTPSDSTVTTAKLASTVFTGATDIGAAIVDADLFLLDDGAGGTIRKTVASRIKTYVEASAMAVTGNITATGEATFGPGGTGTDVVNIIADGGSGAAGGSTFEVRSNGTFRGGLGNKAALLGSGTSTDLELRAASSIPITFAPNNTNALTLDTSGNATFAGRILTDDATEATSTTDGSLQTDGGLSVVKDAVFGDDVKLLSDAAVLAFGADGDVTVTHVADTGVLLNAASQIQFRDSAISIKSTADGQLDIDGDVSVQIETGTLDVNGVCHIDSTNGPTLQPTVSGAGQNTVRAIGSHASYTGNILQPWSVRDTNSGFDFLECVSNNGSAVPARIRGDGQIDTIDNLLFRTSGKGVYLGVTSATAANLLDDYEEGTWTPAFTSTSATFAYTTQGGNYTKVGRMCLLTFRLELDGNAPGGTTSNSVFISGLPFAIATLADTYHGGSIGHYFSINLSQTGVLAYQLSSGASTVELKVVGDNLGETAVLASHLAGAAEIRGQILYHTA